MKKKIAICLLSVLLAAVSVCGCTDKDDKTKTENSDTENNSSLEDIIKTISKVAKDKQHRREAITSKRVISYLDDSFDRCD